ncbi:MAG TPA: sigma-70 family RNA polymerase sigma factor [Nocardioidaceae bacterium]|nr:sigma-70 family RNA polymerase sigma factor [Nocardioidaceae bacterium]
MSGDEQDLAAFYVAFYPRLVTALCVPARDRVEAEDAGQEAFARMIRTGRWGSLSAPEAWLYTVGVNVLRSRWRKLIQARDRAHLVGDRATHAHDDDLSAESLDLREALRELPSRYRDPLVMFYLLDLPIARIAEETRSSVGTVKSQLSRGRQILATRLAEVTIR